MVDNILEQDWKVFKELHPLALERMFQRVLDEVRRELDKPGEDLGDKYRAIYQLVRERDKEIAQTFNDYRRSTAWLQVRQMYSMDLLTKAEMERFSPGMLRGIEGLDAKEA